MKRQTLVERVDERYPKHNIYSQIRVELNRLAGQVRKQNTANAPTSYRDAIMDVLGLIKEAKK